MTHQAVISFRYDSNLRTINRKLDVDNFFCSWYKMFSLNHQEEVESVV